MVLMLTHKLTIINLIWCLQSWLAKIMNRHGVKVNYSKQWQISIKFSYLLLSCCLYLSFLTGCNQDSASRLSDMDTNLNVELGSDLTVNVGESVNLTASIKNLGSSTVTYQWTQTSGNDIELAADNNSYIEFTPLENDSLEFEVTITDNQGMEYTDSVIITVLPENQSAQYSAQLSWAAPTENEDGSSLTNLAGYRIYYGQSATNLDELILVEEPLITSHNIKNLDSVHRYFFCVAAYNTVGLESQCSDTVELSL